MKVHSPLADLGVKITQKRRTASSGRTVEDERILNDFEQIYSERQVKATDVEEVWFAVGP